MYVLRILFRSGPMLDFHFADIGVAQKAIDAVTQKRIELGQVRIMDEAGRDFRFAAEEILTEGLIDVAQETLSVVNVGLEIQEAGMLAKRRAGITEEVPFAPPPSQPAGPLGALLPQDNAADRRVPRFSG